MTLTKLTMKKILSKTLLLLVLLLAGCANTAPEQEAKTVSFKDILSRPPEKQDALYTASCANHFIQLKLALKMANDLKPDLKLPATDDTAKALKKIFIESGVSEKPADWVDEQYCTESYYKKTGFGYVYIGDGIKLKDVVEKDILILFCQGENHRRTSEHGHAWKRTDGMCFKSNKEMLQELKKALKRGNSGEVKYSQRAMKVLKKEIKKREEKS